MNIFKRELLILIRSKLFIFFSPIIIVFLSLFFNRESVNIQYIMGMFPIIISIFVPIIAVDIWIREKKLQMDSYYYLCKFPINNILLTKISANILYIYSVLIAYMPIVYIYSKMGFIDFGKLFSIYCGLLLFVILSICLSLFISTIIKSKIPSMILTTTILLIASFKLNLLSNYYNGLISIGNTFHFLSFSALFYYISLSIISKKIFYYRILFCFVLLILSLFIDIQLDTTKNRIHSVSSNSIEIINKAKSEIIIEYYYSEGIQQNRKFAAKIISYLFQFQKEDNIKFAAISDKEAIFNSSIRVYNPIKDSSDAYNFIVVKYNNSYQVIPRIPSMDLLEFELIKVINYLINGSLKSVGLYIGDSGLSQDNFTILSDLLKENFNVNVMFPGDVISEDLDALVLLGYFNINDYYKDEIGHYLASGGNMLFAGTGIPLNNNSISNNSTVLDSLKGLGVEIEPYLIGSKDNFQEYELFINSYRDYSVSNNPIISEYSGFPGMFTSPIFLNNNFEVLLYSSNDSWIISDPENIEGLPEGRFPIAAYGEGSFSKFFTDHGSSRFNKVVVLGNNISLTNPLNNSGNFNSYDFILRSLYVLTDQENIIEISNRIYNDDSYFKLTFNPYINTIKNVFYLFSILLYPILLLIINILIKKRMRF